MYLLVAISACVLALLLISFEWRKQSKVRLLPCPVSLAWLLEMENPLAPLSHAKQIIADCGIQAGMRVLDAGCGPGRVTIPLAKAVGPSGRVTALDVQSEMLSKVMRKVEGLELRNVLYLESGLGQGNLPSDHFDRIVMVMVLGEIPQREIALEELYQALKSGGRLCITETLFDPHYLRIGSLREKVEEIGFKEVETKEGYFAYTMILEKL